MYLPPAVMHLYRDLLKCPAVQVTILQQQSLPVILYCLNNCFDVISYKYQPINISIDFLLQVNNFGQYFSSLPIDATASLRLRSEHLGYPGQLRPQPGNLFQLAFNFPVQIYISFQILNFIFVGHSCSGKRCRKHRHRLPLLSMSRFPCNVY